MSYAAVEPFIFNTELRADYRAASIMQTIANVNRGPKQKPFALKDFLLPFEEVDKREEASKQRSPEQQRSLHLLWIRSLAQAYSQPGKDE